MTLSSDPSASVTEEITTAESIVVSSPYDGHEVARVPRCDASHVDAAVAAAAALLAEPLAPWQRAEILDALRPGRG
jgi:acyl-CoA reductase-like NAD-dependent aldehyde dehydrogenase